MPFAVFVLFESNPCQLCLRLDFEESKRAIIINEQTCAESNKCFVEKCVCVSLDRKFVVLRNVIAGRGLETRAALQCALKVGCVSGGAVNVSKAIEVCKLVLVVVAQSSTSIHHPPTLTQKQATHKAEKWSIRSYKKNRNGRLSSRAASFIAGQQTKHGPRPVLAKSSTVVVNGRQSLAISCEIQWRIYDHVGRHTGQRRWALFWVVGG
jgi:hypothetical protein